MLVSEKKMNVGKKDEIRQMFFQNSLLQIFNVTKCISTLERYSEAGFPQPINHTVSFSQNISLGKHIVKNPLGNARS